MIPAPGSVDFWRKNSGKWQKGTSRNAVIISGGEILAVMVSSGWSRENAATEYDHRFLDSTFLPFSGNFPPESARTLSPGYENSNFLVFKVQSSSKITLSRFSLVQRVKTNG
jgi:hypothetical protein